MESIILYEFSAARWWVPESCIWHLEMVLDLPRVRGFWRDDEVGYLDNYCIAYEHNDNDYCNLSLSFYLVSLPILHLSVAAFSFLSRWAWGPLAL